MRRFALSDALEWFENPAQGVGARHAQRGMRPACAWLCSRLTAPLHRNHRTPLVGIRRRRLRRSGTPPKPTDLTPPGYRLPMAGQAEKGIERGRERQRRGKAP